MRGPLGDGVQTLSAHEGLSWSDVWLNCHRNQSCVWWVFRMTGHSGEGHQCLWMDNDSSAEDRHVTLTEGKGGCSVCLSYIFLSGIFLY